MNNKFVQNFRSFKVGKKCILQGICNYLIINNYTQTPIDHIPFYIKTGTLYI
ncbi:hypothetical protein Q2T41_11065 [Maribacter confluentis]|uniref:AraC family transcriptional regulator n=1 Tax=Maribacter confluentis TaxID=1656093 RepID=A0ABT8RSW3_9FLAO|nr:hypothetical protein [Maribacter confluentis]MDO1513196.1 hypothetical protein [Maribacter confluentis]